MYIHIYLQMLFVLQASVLNPFVFILYIAAPTNVFSFWCIDGFQ